jgi:hypothetical protein
MDKEQIKRWAREAGMVIYEGDQDRVLFDVSIADALNRFANLVAAHEREAIAADADWCIQNNLEHLIPERIRARK